MGVHIAKAGLFRSHDGVVEDIIQWDVATWKHGLRFWEERVGSLQGKHALEIGSWDGGLSLFLALKGCHVVCTDVQGPTARAAELHARYGVGDLVQYSRADAKHIPFPNEQFDLVVLKSVLGALGSEGDGVISQQQAVAEVRRVLKPGGIFLFAENLRGSPVHALARRRLVPWGRSWHYFTKDEIVRLVSPFGATDLCYRGFLSAFGRHEWQRRLLHSVDVLIEPLVPCASRYVVFGLAKK